MALLRINSYRNASYNKKSTRLWPNNFVCSCGVDSESHLITADMKGGLKRNFAKNLARKHPELRSRNDEGNKFCRGPVSITTLARSQNARERARTRDGSRTLLKNLSTFDMSPHNVGFVLRREFYRAKRLFSSFTCFQTVATTCHAGASIYTSSDRHTTFES